MILVAKTVSLLLVLGAAFSLVLDNVDPNTLSCDPAGQVFLLLPHFTDCAKFYMCNRGNEVEFSCALGTIFDFPLQTCNHPWATECWLRDTEDKIDGSNEEAEDSGEEVDGSGEEVEGSGKEEVNDSGEEVNDSGEEVNDSGEEDDGSGEEVEGSGEEVNDSGEEVEGSGEEVDGSGDEIDGFGEEAPAPESLFSAKLDCNNAHDAARSVPFLGDCQRFWRCVNGLTVSAFCSDGLFFNERTMQCDFEANVRCNVNPDEELQGEYMIFE